MIKTYAEIPHVYRYQRVKVQIIDSRGQGQRLSLELPEPLDRKELADQIAVAVRQKLRQPQWRRGDCEFCGEAFYVEVTPAPVPRWCETHQQASKRVPPCPRPEKRAFASKRAALGWALTSATGTGSPMRTYKCECGRWHITHKMLTAAQRHQ